MSSGKTVAQLEAELLELKLSTTKALEESWLEVERMRNDFEARLLERQTSPSCDITAMERSTTSTSSESTSQGCQNNRAHNAQDTPSVFSTYDRSDISAISWGSSLLSETLGSFRWTKQSNERRQTQIEEHLMKQLAFLQKDKSQCVLELELKLSQREAAIATLESALEVKDTIIWALREELEELRINQQNLESLLTGVDSNNNSERRSRRAYNQNKKENHTEPSSRTVALSSLMIREDPHNFINNGHVTLGVRSPSARRSFKDQSRTSVVKSPIRSRSMSPFKPFLR